MRTPVWIVIIVAVALLALVLAGSFATGGEKKEMDGIVKRGIPPIDLQTPGVTETATFALG